MELNELLPSSTKILIADDVISARVSLKGFLKALGYNDIIEAGDGQELINSLISNPNVGLIICDWEMPQMHGIDVVRQLQKDGRF